MGLAHESEAALLKAASAARERAYAPYSHFAVGAALLDEHGHIHAGCNVENAAYPQGVCAEAGALSALVLSGARQVRAVLVIGDGGELPVMPCGGCRQKLREFAADDAPVLVANAASDGPHGEPSVVHRGTLGELLPHSFGPQHLRATKATP